MDLIQRDAAAADVEQCLAITADRFLYDALHLDALRRMWSCMIESRSGLFAVLCEDRAPSQVLFFATTVFVPEVHARRYHRLESPGIGRAMAIAFASGYEPFLSREHIARANAGAGLHLVVTHHGLRVPDDADFAERLRSATYEYALRSFRGWNLLSYTNEVFAENPARDAKEMGRVLGFRVARYTDAQLRAAGIPAERAPWVWTATRDDLGAGPVAVALGVLFRTFSVPRFAFDCEEQRLLVLALDGNTDESIARLTNTSLTSVKKRFRGVYEKVRDATTDWETPLCSETLDGVRGIEMRRHLLRYLADHPEELRPYEPAQNRKARTLSSVARRSTSNRAP